MPGHTLSGTYALQPIRASAAKQQRPQHLRKAGSFCIPKKTSPFQKKVGVVPVKTESKKHFPVRRVRVERAPTPPPTYQAKNPASPDTAWGSEGEPRRQRRALSHVGGEVQFQGGSTEEQEVLLRALDVSADEDEVMEDVHGFHSYPARLHPATARGLIEGLSKPGATVLDPFCGSGTVVVEAKALGRMAMGSDLNPLAVELSWLKSRAPTQKLVEEMLSAASHIAEVAEERRVAKADPYLRYGEEDRERYPVHILLELDSLAHGISLVGKAEIQRMLRLVISSTLTKLANSEGDTTRRAAPRRLPGGFAIQLFVQKTQELAERLAAYRSRAGDRSPRAYVGCNDARELKNVESDSVDLIVTSPPYPGVYDYLDHHMHRIRWLGLREGGLRGGEIGARREYRRMRVDEAAARWQEEIGATLYELRRTLAPDGRGVIIIADSVIDRQPLRADEQVKRVAQRAGIDITCIASQERPLFLHGAENVFSSRPRMEHVVIFRPGQRPHRKDAVERSIDKELHALRDRERPARFDNSPPPRLEAPERAPRFGQRGPNDAPRRSTRGDNERSFGSESTRPDQHNAPRYPSRDNTPRSFRSDSSRPDQRSPHPSRDDAPRGFRSDAPRGPRPDQHNPPRSFPQDDSRRGFRSDAPRRDDSRRGDAPPRNFHGQDRSSEARPTRRDDSGRPPARRQDTSQPRTWDSKPRGPGSPRSKSGPKPK